MTDGERTACIVALCLLFLFIHRRALLRPVVLIVRASLLCLVLAVVALAVVG